MNYSKKTNSFRMIQMKHNKKLLNKEKSRMIRKKKMIFIYNLDKIYSIINFYYKIINLILIIFKEKLFFII